MKKHLRIATLKAGAAPIVLGFASLSTQAYAQTAAPQAQPAAPAAQTQPAPTATPQAQPAPTADTQAQPAPPIANQPAPAEPGADIVVTGSRIPQPNLESVAPVTVVSSQDIKLQGTTRVEDLLNALPSVSASQGSTISNGSDGTATVDLRGLGTSRTLSLVNGRRLLPGDPSPTSGSAADINIIPAALVKRIEVLTGGASSTYGADAVAGVVNFIMDTDFTGIRIDGQYSFYQHDNGDRFLTPLLEAQTNAGISGFGFPDGSVADGGAVDATISIGSKFADDKGHAMVYFGYRKVDPITQDNRDYSACVLQNSGTGAAICGGSATSGNGNAIVFDDPRGTGVTSTIFTFAPNGGFNNSTSLFNFAPTNYYQRPDERYTAGMFANYEINDSIKPYLEFMFMDDRTVSQVAPSGDFGNTLTINSDNPLISPAQRAIIFNPQNLINGFLGTFPTAVGAPYNPTPEAAPLNFIDPTTGVPYQRGFFQLLRRNVEGGPRQADLQHTNFRAVIGSKGDLDKVWSYDAYYQYGRSNFTQVFLNDFSITRLTRALDVVTGPGGTPICRSVRDGTDPLCAPYNVFGGAGAASAASVAYLSTPGFQKGQTSEQVASVSFTGALGEYGVRTPWTEEGVAVNVGAEYRKESLELETDLEFSTGDLSGQGGATLPISGNFHVYEFFGETKIPVVHDNFIYDLSFDAGYRRSMYKTSADRSYDTDTYKFGVELAPIRDVRLRASYNRAVRAPNIQELFATTTVALNGTNDPCAGITITATDFGCLAQGLVVGQRTASNPAGQYNGFIGGNPDLQPEKATTKTFGVVFQPSFAPRLVLTVDYYDIKVDNAIRSFGQDATLADCVANATATFTPASCGLARRDAASSIWLTPGGFVVDLPNNIGEVQTKGIEFNASYSHNFGGYGLSFGMIGTYLDSYLVSNGLTQPYDCAGLYGPTCSAGGTTQSGAPMPKWRHKARVTLQTPGGIGLSVQWRFIDSVRAETLENNQSLQGDFNFGPGLDIKAYNYFDLVATFAVGDSFNFRLGVNNVFDKQPPFVTSGNSNRSGSNLCPTGPCNGNTFPGTWDALGRYLFAGATLNF